MADYQHKKIRLTWRSRFIGRQYSDLQNIEEWSIDPVTVSSVSASVKQKNLLGLGTFNLSLRIDNLFDKKYEAAVAYAENYAYRSPGKAATVDAWSTYYVAAERSFFVQLQLETF